MLMVFGASGFIGNYIYAYFKQKYIQTVGTYCSKIQDKLMAFDFNDFLVDELVGQIKKNKISYAIFSSGQTNIDAIKREVGYFQKINVDNPIKVIKILADLGVVPIYISTDCVFDGSKGDYVEDDKREPQTIYGKQKVMIEDYLINNFKDYLLFRISKIYSSDLVKKNWLADWVEAISEDKAIPCAVDQVFCPTHVMDIVEGIEKLIECEARGVYHLANPVKYSKYDLGLALCKVLNKDKKVINPVKINEIGLLEERPLDTSLNSNKFITLTKHSFRSIVNTVGEIVKK